MVGKKNIRDYEVSIWTLQDSFITVLKQSNLENREKIQEPKMTLKDDGEYTFSFKIPMYLQEDSDLTKKPYFKRERIWKENPIWYTVHNGNLMVNLRKVKVIFNKKSPDEEVFEFIINKITERHEGYSKICEVDCDGLAFHELGKQGYEIELSGDNYRAEIENLIDETEEENENEDNESLEDFDAPVNNINYWVEKVLENSNWDYIINMDWSIYDGIIVDNKTYLKMTDEEREEFNNARASAEPPLRRKDTIYKDPYVSSWNINNGNIVAETVVDDISQLEKLKTVEGKESNRYNLLQTIAETFQVFCKFKYEYDDNYHIIGRKVIFYNNFINESEGVIDFNYSYNTDEITREMESSDLVTKMYVKSLKDAGTFSGEVSLADTDANPTLENFLFNFDYLYKIGTISQEQYDLIKDLQVTLRAINLQYAEQNKLLEKYERQKIDEEVKLASAKDMIEQATQRVAEADAELDVIKDGSLYPNFGNNNPLRCYLIHYSDDSTKAYINLQKAFSGLHPNSLKLYKEVNKDNSVKGNYIDLNNISFEKNEETQLITKIIVENITASTDVLYATFDFDARTPSETIKQMWVSRAKQAEIDKEEAQAALGINDEEVISPNGFISKIEEISGKNGTLEDLLSQRAEIIAKFERLMGPALREGTWQPEDEYADYQMANVYNLGPIPLTNGNTEQTDGKASFIWDNELFNGEQKLYYLFGIDGIKKYYPCIKLTPEQWNNLQDVDNLNLIYRDIYLGQYTNNGPYSMSDTKVNHYLAVGASNGCQFAFLRGLSGDNKGKIIPVIMVLGIESVLEAKVGSTTYTSYQQIQQSARLRPIEITNDGLIEDGTQGIDNIDWIIPTENTYEIVYPRFKINSHNYLLTFPENKVFLNNEPLEIMSDYTDELYRDGDEYITIKNVLLGDENKYSFHYALSTAAEAMYLDAIKILKENSVPKTSYTIKPIAIDNSIVGTAYNSIGQLAHINDHELKFKNVQGYISEVELDLDKPWEDSYTIKNYKTKFEDLFSTIVAQTESMKKNSQIFSMMTNAFDANGYLTEDMINNIKERTLVYVPTPEEIYKKYASIIREQLENAFTEAGEVLIAAQNSVSDVNNYNISNSAILNNFTSSIAGSLDRAAIDINKEAGYINIYAVNPQNKDASLLRIDNENGIYLGSDKSITFYSGDVNATESAASALISKDRILFGVSDGSTGTAVDLTKDYIVFGSNFATNNYINTTPTQTGPNIGENTSGVKITKDAIKMASGSETNRSYFNLDKDKLEFGVANNASNGGFIQLTKTGKVTIGVGNDSIITTNTTTGFKTVDANKTTASFEVYAPNFIVDSEGKLYANNAYISGTIYSSAGWIGGWDINENFLTSTTTRDGKTYITGLQKQSFGTWAIAVAATNMGDWSTAPFRVQHNGALWATSAHIEGEVAATSGSFGDGSNKIKIGSNATHSWIYSSNKTGFKGASNGFFIGTEGISLGTYNSTSGHSPFEVSTAGMLYATGANISGTIQATAGRIGGTYSNNTWSGGWIISSTHIGDNDVREKSKVGISTAGTVRFWAGASGTPTETNGINLNTTNFYVLDTGKLYANNAEIKGTITATSGSIGSWKITTNGIYSEKIGSTTSGWRHSLLQTTNPNDLALVIAAPLTGVTFNDKLEITGATYDNNSAPFRVTNAGKLYATDANITGDITLTSYSTQTNGQWDTDNKYFKFIAKRGTKTVESFSLSSWVAITSAGVVDTSETIMNSYGDLQIKNNRSIGISSIADVEYSTNQAYIDISAYTGIEMYEGHGEASLTLDSDGIKMESDNIILKSKRINIDATETSITTNRFSFIGQGGNTQYGGVLTRVYIGESKPTPSSTLGRATAILWIKPTATVYTDGKETVNGVTYNFNWYKCEFYYAQPHNTFYEVS